MLKGIDVSEHQGRINWDRVKGNIDFAILRAGYGRNNIDKQFIRNIEECNRLGIPVGIYWFSYAHDVAGAKAEANYVLEAIKPYKIDYPVCYDFEYDTLRYASQQGFVIGKRLATDMINAFCSIIEQAGYKAMNYANPDFINNKFYNNEVKYPLWIAWYGVSEDRAKAYNPAMWQYSESGSIAGIGTNSVDMNYCYEDLTNKNNSPNLKKNINNEKIAFDDRTNARALVSLDPRDKPSDDYIDLGEIYADERFRILPEVCDKEEFLPVVYWKDSLDKESEKVWIRSKQDYMMIDTYHKVVNVVTELDARYEPSPNSSRMGYVHNGERLYVHKIEGNYALCTYFAGNGYKTAWFTAKYIEKI